MIKILSLLLCLIAAWSGNVSAQSLKTAKLVFDTYTHDFGKIKEVDGEVSHTFRYTNEGTLPLVIQSVGVSCVLSSLLGTFERRRNEADASERRLG